jgi:hypothetical protein
MLCLKLLTSKTAMLALGAASAASWNVVGPMLGNVVRPLLKEAIKGGLLLQKQVQSIAQEAWQDIEDLTAEAKAEMDRKKAKPKDKQSSV